MVSPTQLQELAAESTFRQVTLVLETYLDRGVLTD
jgi:hypothetical protein